MRELRIMLPDELWDKFNGQSPQQMKSAIATVICLQFHVRPEPKHRKPATSSYQHRGSGGRFANTPLTDAPLPEQKLVNAEVVAHRVPSVSSATEIPPGITGQKPETPLEITVQKPASPKETTIQEPETPPKITVQKPEIPLEIPVNWPETQQAILQVSESGIAQSIKIHPAYAVGLKAA